MIEKVAPTLMHDSRFLTIFYMSFAFILAGSGLGLTFAPGHLVGLWHPEQDSSQFSPVLARQAGIGLLLASALSALCVAAGHLRRNLHWLLLAFLFAFVASHGTALVRSPGGFMGLWLLVPVLIFAAPLVPWRAAPRLVHLSTGRDSLAGEVKWFNPNKGFGFILTEDGREIFVHFRALQNGGRRSLQQGARVRFVINETDRGEQAEKVFIEN